jgi:TPR repeat protein
VLAVPKDRARGLLLLTEAEAFAHSGEATFLLGLACRRPAQAFAWYLLAAERGHPPGQAAAGRALFLGDGVPRDEVKVRDPFTRFEEE